MPRPQIAHRPLIAHLSLALLVLGGSVLVVWPPEHSPWYPLCPFARYLHLLCPGCGATRALSALLRGRLREALHWNPLFVLLLPPLLIAALQSYRRALRPPQEEYRWPHLPAKAAWCLLAVAAVFTVVRNLPGHGL